MKYHRGGACTLVASAWVLPATARSVDHDAPPPYCSFDMSARGVPPVSDPTRLKGYGLSSVLAVVRHGARAPCAQVSCWPGFTSDLDWGCDYNDLSAPLSALNNKSEPWTLFEKTATERDGTPPGMCVLGQLLPEGLAQHEANGDALRAAYVGDNPAVASLVKKREVLAPGDFFFRSSDLPRTIASGQQLASAFLRESLPRRVKWHAPNLGSDYIYGDPAACPKLALWQQDIYTGASFEAWNDSPSVQDVISEVNSAVGGEFPWELPDLEGPTLDCLMVNRCIRGGLPGVSPELFDKATQLVYAREAWKLNAIINSTASGWSKLAMAPLAQEIIGLLSNDSPRFSLFAAHDTTLNPLLAALGVWDGQWVPYASMLHIERWTSPNGPSRARLLFNGKELILPLANGPVLDLSILLGTLEDFAVPLDEWTSNVCAVVPSIETAPSPSSNAWSNSFALPMWLKFSCTFAAGIAAGLLLTGCKSKREIYRPIIEPPSTSLELISFRAATYT